MSLREKINDRFNLALKNKNKPPLYTYKIYMPLSYVRFNDIKLSMNVPYKPK